MWKIKRYKQKGSSAAAKTVVTYNGIPVDGICSYQFGTEMQSADFGSGQVAVDTLSFKIQMPDVVFEEELVDNLNSLESKYSKDEIGPNQEDKSFGVELLQKSYAAERTKNTKVAPESDLDSNE